MDGFKCINGAHGHLARSFQCQDEVRVIATELGSSVLLPQAVDHKVVEKRLLCLAGKTPVRSAAIGRNPGNALQTRLKAPDRTHDRTAERKLQSLFGWKKSLTG